MGVFDKSICDCCVCPMQSVMKGLVETSGISVAFFTPNNTFFATLNSAENFVANTNNGMLPICNVTAVADDSLDRSTPLKPIQNDSKGECSCCEDPSTNELVSLGVGSRALIEFVKGGFSFTLPLEGNITNIGEGIVILDNVIDADGSNTPNFAISTCQITRVEGTQ
ncbi:hypothetical protein [Chengkuizengella axinellae]|uniref:DUF4280 domain-containing protein n=1 Tax=Chengkuizengella axinellae TaxID=3064388 RepID=A0ABT9IYR7_9BACL|nr:hypothetical protein [Chengkuizengella sp. 2205SS18-9]MDP5274467.1 hypothetical protein [Chengkuizengella sp. 2205SS18-9]MDP5276355.1 hypothetical protein [Chengkuizengella sp. 2205SS18-9]